MTANRLIHEKSPYLLQHAHNPVDWYPWSDEAFERARAEDKPVLVSIGYATCHWCHVMEKESFEDEETAGYLNETFISIKVDREERPDIDAVYMAACQMLTGSGGWPLNIFMTPDKKPFFAATYIPKESRFGRSGVIDLCRQVKNIWRSQRENVLESAGSIVGNLGNAFAFASAEDLDNSVLDRAYSQIESGFDSGFGGFGAAPKFPTPHRLLFLLRHYHRTGNANALEMVKKTLTDMRLGGIWDHVGFGFHRYSTDREWLLPHFEKMLYDQALLAIAYLEAYQVTTDPFFAQTADEIFTYVARDMTSEEGAFFAAEDADSEGEEGKFYVWSTAEFRQILGTEDATHWERLLSLHTDGNFADEATRRKTGTNILHLKKRLTQAAEDVGMETEDLLSHWEKARTKLFEARKRRIHPLKDDKVLTDWNGLMIAALSLGARVLNKPEYADAAQKAVRFILTKMQDDQGRLYHRFREGEVRIRAHADDFAFLIMGLLELYGATFDPACLEQAISLQKGMLRDYWDKEAGGFYLTAEGAEELPVRPKELYDGAIPSANSVSLLNLLRLTRLTGDTVWEEKAQVQTRAFSGTVKSQPTAYTQFLLGLDFALNPGQEVVITGEPEAPEVQEMFAALNRSFMPNKVALLKSGRHADQLAKIAGYTAGLQPVQGKSTVHMCKNFACTESTTDVQNMLERLLKKS